MHHIVIGNGVAGINAANTIRNLDDDCEITIISYEHDHFFSRTGLMYTACGQLSERCLEPYERDYYDIMKFNRVRDKVTSIEPNHNRINLKNGKTLNYDKLLIASGSKPLTVNWPGIDLDGVGNFVTWDNLKWLQKEMKTAKRAVVVGGGLIGIETVEVLLQAGIKVTFLIREDYFWPIALDENEGTIVGEHMRHHGCDVRLKTLLKQVIGENGRVAAIETEEGERIETDIVVFTIGVTPQTEFLEGSGVELGERKGIVVNDYLQTNFKNIYAAGDCAEVVWFNNVRRPEQLWYTGRDQGRVAGMNMTGQEKIYKRGTFYNSAKFFDIEYTTAGLVNFNLANEQNWYFREQDSYYTVRVTYLPDDSVVGFNMLGRRWDHRVLVKWIEQKRKLKWVVEHMQEALYDEEFMSKFQLASKVS